MAREPREHDYYAQLQELHSVHSSYRYNVLHGPTTSAAPPFEGTAGGAEPAAQLPAPAPAAPVPVPVAAPPATHDQRKRKQSHYGAGAVEAGCELSLPLAPPPPSSRKRKSSSYGAPSAYDDGGDDDARSARTLPDKKQNHSEIEKRRRDKMNTYISELSAMVPVCGAMARKLDKLTVLRLAVQHLRAVRGALAACPLAARPRPGLLPPRDLNALVLRAATDAFLLVVGCDRGRLLYVSASVTNLLHYEQSELLGQSLFDILHPKDVTKVKEQLSSSDLSPRERLIDAKTMLPVRADVVAGASRLCPGARRSFLCRVKCRAPASSTPAPPVKEEPEPKHPKKLTHEKKYCVVQCTGYLKSWASAEVCEGGPRGGGASAGAGESEEGEGGASCLVAGCRALPPPAPPAPPHPAAPPARCLQFVSRHATDGKFLFVDQRVTLALGFLPQELLGSSLYEFVHSAQLAGVARAHKAALLRGAPLLSPLYAFRRKDGLYATVQTQFKPFRNPWTKDVECLVANNTVTGGAPLDDAGLPYDFFKQTDFAEERGAAGAGAGAGAEGECEGVQRLIESQRESHKIGSAIAEEALRRASPGFSPDLPADLLHDSVFNPQVSLMDNILGVETGYEVRNNVPLSAAASSSPADAGVGAAAAGAGGGAGTPPAASPPLPPLGLDGNGEAAMAVIMSLLEADAGLGGPINFSGLPWPLP